MGLFSICCIICGFCIIPCIICGFIPMPPMPPIGMPPKGFACGLVACAPLFALAPVDAPVEGAVEEGAGFVEASVEEVEALAAQRKNT